MVGLRTLHDVITKVQPKRKQPTSKIDKSNLYVFLQTGAFNNGYGGNGKITVLFGFET